jgi:hypothetical protein
MGSSGTEDRWPPDPCRVDIRVRGIDTDPGLPDLGTWFLDTAGAELTGKYSVTVRRE